MPSEEGDTRRLFVAVPLPEELWPFVLQAQALLAGAGGIRLLEPGHMHVTLAFIGTADAESTEAARAVIRTIPVESAGEAWVDGFLFMPSPKRARVVALRLVDEMKVFETLFESVMGRLEQSKVMQREKRPFRAHVTVARLRRPGPLQPTSDCGRAPFRVESVCLYESQLLRAGARYTIIERAGLSAAAD